MLGTRQVKLFWQDSSHTGSLRERFVHGAFWSFLGTAVYQGLTIAANILGARLLGGGRYGMFGIVLNTVGMCGVFAGAGLGMTATKYLAEFRGTDKARAGRTLGLCLQMTWLFGVVVSLVLFFTAPYLATFLAKANSHAHSLTNMHVLTLFLRLGIALLFFNALIGVQNSAFSGLEAFTTLTWINLLRGALAFPFILAGVHWYGVAGMIVGSALAAALGCLISQGVLAHKCGQSGIRVDYSASFREGVQLFWDFSLPAFIANLLVAPLVWWASSLLVRQQGWTQMGVFTAVSQWRNALIYIFSMFAGVNLPVLANLFGQRNRAGFNKVLRTSALLTLGVALVVIIPLLFLASWLMALFGKDFAHAGTMLIITAITSFFIAISSILGQVMAAIRAIWVGCCATCSGALPSSHWPTRSSISAPWAWSMPSCSPTWCIPVGAGGIFSICKRRRIGSEQYDGVGFEHWHCRDYQYLRLLTLSLLILLSLPLVRRLVPYPFRTAIKTIFCQPFRSEGIRHQQEQCRLEKTLPALFDSREWQVGLWAPPTLRNENEERQSKEVK